MQCRLPRRIGTPKGDGVNYVEYIESDGNSYFNTGVIGKTGIKAVGKIRMLDISGASIPLGCYGANRCYMLSFNGTTPRYGYIEWYNGSTSISANVDYEFEIDFSANSQSLKLNGTTYVSSSNATTFTNNYPIYAFAYNDAGTAEDFAKCRYGSLAFDDNGTLVKDYWAALDPNGVACFYDRVNKAYEYGVGTFTAGASISGGDSGGGSTSTKKTLSMTGDAWNVDIYAEINGTQYQAATELEVEAGTVVTIQLPNVGIYTKYVYLNNVQVASSLGVTKYSFAVSSNTVMNCETASGQKKYLYITTE